MTTALEQLPEPYDIDVVAGDAYKITIVNESGLTLASPTLALRTAAGDVFTGGPTAALSSGNIVTSFTGAQTAAMNTTSRGRKFRFSIGATLDGAGPYQLLGGWFTVRPIGSAGTGSASATITPTITVGGPTFTLSVGDLLTGRVLLDHNNLPLLGA